MSNQTPQVSDLFQAAFDAGDISRASLSTLEVVDIGANIQNALGTPVDDIEATETVLLAILIDDSSSISAASNTQAVIDGHNGIVDALVATAQRDGIMLHTRLLNGPAFTLDQDVINPFTLVNSATKLDSKNYNPHNGTPLYDRIAQLLATALAKMQDFENNGVATRAVVMVVTDGEDTTSRKQTPTKLKTLVEDLLRTEKYIIAAMGIDDGHTNFRAVFQSMGIPDQWILTPGNTAGEIRRAFQLVSRSATAASVGASNFKSTAIGGFGT